MTDFWRVLWLAGNNISHKVTPACVHLDSSPIMGVFGSSTRHELQPDTSKGTMKKKAEESLPSPLQIEAEVMAEGREWTRKRLEARLQALADQQSEVFPPEPEATRTPAPLPVRTPHRRRRH